MSEMESTSENWSRQHTLILIEGLRNNPCLWNPLNNNFTNNVKRSESLNSILKKLIKVKKNCTLQTIKNKLRTLQSQMCREKGKILNSKKSGASADDVYVPKLWCYNELSFLVHCNDTEDSTSTIELDMFGVDEVEQAEEAIENKSKKKRKPNKAEILQQKALSALESYKTYIETPTKNKLTREEKFCEYLCSELSKIQLEVNFDELKLEILQLVAKKIREEKTMLQDEVYFKPIFPTHYQSGPTNNQNIKYPTSTPSSIPSPFSFSSDNSYSQQFPETSSTENENDPPKLTTSIPIENYLKYRKSHYSISSSIPSSSSSPTEHFSILTSDPKRSASTTWNLTSSSTTSFENTLLSPVPQFASPLVIPEEKQIKILQYVILKGPDIPNTPQPKKKKLLEMAIDDVFEDLDYQLEKNYKV